MPPIKFQSNPIYGMGEQMPFQDFQAGNHRGQLGIGTEISNSKSTCHPNASHQTWAEFHLPFRSRRGLKIFKMATMATISMLLRCLLLSFSPIQFTVWEEMSLEDFQDGQHSGHLEQKSGMILAILNLHVAPMPLTNFGLNLTTGLGVDVFSRFSR